ncbi:hypothetical protein GWK08_09130 [Leptobacterium flavescens]|uniref:DUF6249 domain-containing protein n=1 Tax=Leptobacterium flavescens TaxID=472055 RepID=A0A6P0UNV4_9FLAO|nr:DUF6249 domain-containing protein [Leptobacterium flavescens]NER13598.1 hypothetical protein [Leptobacterium flavescens]
MDTTEGLVMGIGVFGGAVLIVYILARYTYLIKKAMIEKGITTEASGNKYKYLDLGCIILGLGMGLGVSSVFTTMSLSEDTADLLIWATILLFSGFGLLAAHFVRRKFE